VKTIPAALAYSDDATTVCQLLKVIRTDGVEVGFSSLDSDLTVAGLLYRPGFDLSAMSSTSTLAVDNLELTVISDDDEEMRNDLLAGRWDHAFFELAEANWRNPSAVNILKRGHLGEVRMERSKFVVEFRSLTQALQQRQGVVTQKTCRSRLGDSACRVDLEPFTRNGTFTDIVGRRVFVDAARTEEAGYFTEGILTVTSGASAGISQKIRTYEAGTFTMSLPYVLEVAVGDTYTAIAGCRKRLEDCRDKFDNVLNFQAEPHLPGLDALTRPGGSSTESAEVPESEGADPGYDAPGDGGW
jgi:uncharacterized phage protein (TIGR02218 family)